MRVQASFCLILSHFSSVGLCGAAEGNWGDESFAVDLREAVHGGERRRKYQLAFDL